MAGIEEKRSKLGDESNTNSEKLTNPEAMCQYFVEL